MQATATEDATGRPALSIKFDDESAAKLAAITEAHIGEAVPLRIDDEVLMSPRVMERISGGNILVSGDFEIDQLDVLAVRLAPPCDQESPRAN
ncbi:MAG: SecDF P1 head subdomain-containing protein [Paracoccus sp. (in: a-proteobacteria)]